MGVTSPFLGIAPSPLLKSRSDTPLSKANGIPEDYSHEDCFELCPPAMPLPAAIGTIWADDKVAVEINAGAPPSPLWPVPPPRLSQLKQHNTFLTFHDEDKAKTSPQLPVRPRALSDFTGLQVMTQVMKPGECALEAVAGSLEENRMADDYDRYDFDDQWVEVLLPLDEVQNWQEAVGAVPVRMGDQTDRVLQYLQMPTEYSEWPQTSPASQMPAPPPLPEGKEAYKPWWVYTSSRRCAPTTLLLKNLPSDLTQSQFVTELNLAGFSGLYDFVFLPVSLRTGRSSRHAIVNMVRHSYGLSLASHFHKRMDWGVGNGVPSCQVEWSLFEQGLLELLEVYRNDVTMHFSVGDDLRPALFSEGWQIPMPVPTRHIRAPPRRLDAYKKINGQVPSNTEGPVSSNEKTGDDDLQLEATNQWPDLASSSRRTKGALRSHA